MNKGKICISVCAETADKLIEQINRADKLADVIEIRFDCLNESEFNILDAKKSEEILKKILVGNSVRNKIILTFRPKEQGGRRKLSIQERYNFWNSCYATWGADLERELYDGSWCWLYEVKIYSHHDFNGVPDNLEEIFQEIKGADLVDVIKIAAQTADITDTIPIWKLLKRAKLENKEIIPIAMGESGKWTRILGLAHGAFMTYAALDAGSETAPGQVTARDLTEVYRVKELDEHAKVYGVLGGDTSYSMSPFLHNAAFKFHKLNSVFVPLQTQNLDEFIKRMVKPETREIELNFQGFSVTNPHKQNIIKHLDFVDETARKIGAVNTVKIADGKLYGYNTDAQGFIEPLQNSYGDLNGAKVAILGAGGAARACIYALKQQNAIVTIFARNPEKAEGLAKEFQIEIKPLTTHHSPLTTDFDSYDILVNATPLGTKGEFETQTTAIAEQFDGIKLAYDLVYNPFQTKFMQESAKVHVPVIGGLAMLAAQAAAQQKIWTDLDAPIKEMSRAVLQRLN